MLGSHHSVVFSLTLPYANFLEKEKFMPEQETLRRAEQDKREGKSASTQAGEFVGEEMHHIREGKHGARSAKQAIAIGLSKARRAGVNLPPPRRGTVSERTRKSAESAYKAGRKHKRPSGRRSRATLRALKREPHASASHRSLARQAHVAAQKRTRAQRSAAARKAARTRARATAKKK